MTYKVYLSTEAQKFYATAEPATAKKIARCLLQLEQTPQQHSNVKALKGKLAGYYRYRIGDYRVVYLIDEQNNQVLVDTIAHRRGVYELS
jgi:mRNA interferase RelE/StbE